MVLSSVVKRVPSFLPALLLACPFWACSPMYHSLPAPNSHPCIREYTRVCTDYENALKRSGGKKSYNLDQKRRECEASRRSCDATMQRENFNTPPKEDPETGIPMWKQ